MRKSGQPVKIHDIAGAQNIPPRFLEVILNQLRHAGFVDSQRGNEGGYMLARTPESLTVGEIIQYIQGPIAIAADNTEKPGRSGCFFGDYAFEQLWRRVNSAFCEVCDNTTFAELVECEMAKKSKTVPSYSI